MKSSAQPAELGAKDVWVCISSADKVGLTKQTEVLVDMLGVSESKVGYIFLDKVSPWQYFKAWYGLNPPPPWQNHLKQTGLNQKTPGQTIASPKLLITSGNRAMYFSLAAKKYWAQLNKSDTTATTANSTPFRLHFEKPSISTRNFDLVLAARHDHLYGSNVMPFSVGLTRLSKELLDAQNPNPNQTPTQTREKNLATVLLGGNNSVYHIDKNWALKIGSELAKACEDSGLRLLLSTSRRTPKVVSDTLTAVLADYCDEIYVADSQGPNPYEKFLACAKSIVVTSESAAMMADASSSGRSVYLLPLEKKPYRNRARQKFEEIQKFLTTCGYARWFAGDLRPYPNVHTLDNVNQLQPMLRRKLESVLD